MTTARGIDKLGSLIDTDGFYLAHHPGLRALGGAWTAFLAEHLDKYPPSGFFTRLGWSRSSSLLPSGPGEDSASDVLKRPVGASAVPPAAKRAKVLR